MQRIRVTHSPYHVHGYAGSTRVIVPDGEYLASMTQFERPDTNAVVPSLFLMAATGAPNTYVIVASEFRELDHWPRLPETGSPFVTADW